MLERLRSADRSGNTLILELTSNAPSVGLQFGFALGGYAISDIRTDTPGAGGYPPCTPTRIAGLTTKNSGIDCSFAEPQTFVAIRFVTSARYPEDGEGFVYDHQDKQTRRILGPDYLTTGRAEAAKNLPQMIEFGEDWAYWTCNNLHSDENVSPLDQYGLGLVALVGVFAARDACYNELQYQYHMHGIYEDPPDSGTHAVAAPVLGPVPSPPPCPKRLPPKGSRLCALLRADAARRSAATVRADAVTGAIVTALNRLSTARGRRDSVGIGIQEAALGALDAEALQTAAALDLADGYLAADLDRLHENPLLNAGELSRAVRDVQAGRLPATVLARLRREGITRGAITKSFAGAQPPQAPLRLLDMLEARTISTATTQELRDLVSQLTPSDLAALVKGLANGRAITAPMQQRLTGDANRLVHAGAGVARTRALQQTRADAARVPGQTGQLLSVMAQAIS